MTQLSYINNFVFNHIESQQDSMAAHKSIVYYSGINLTRFLPITAGKHGLASNPALRGLQITNHKVRALAISQGAVPKTSKARNTSAPTNDTWYCEGLIIENVKEGFAQQLYEFSIVTLVKTVVKTCIFSIDMPDHLLPSDELETLLSNIINIHGRTQEQLKMGRNFVP